jgi:hypothetical protein
VDRNALFGVKGHHPDLPSLDVFRNLDEKVGTVASIVVSRDKVVESNKSKREVLCLRILEAGKYDLHDGYEVLLESSPSSLHA